MSMSADRMAASPMLLRNDQAGVATLTLNRPEQYNALSVQMLTELQAALDDIAAEERTRVVIIAANGEAFCAGHDLKEVRTSEDRGFHQALVRAVRPRDAAHQCLATTGHRQGAGDCCRRRLPAGCDLAVSVEHARFAVSGINVGLFCATPAIPLSRNMPRKQAMQMLLTGDFISAQQAQQFGLVNEVVTAQELEATTRAIALKIMAKSAMAIRLGKETFYKQLQLDFSDAYA